MTPPRRTYDAYEGAHTLAHFGRMQSFTVEYLSRGNQSAKLAGWYWRKHATPADTLTGSEPLPIGPFASSRAAFRDARAKC